MKMYYFTRGGYNEEYHVMAESKQDALLYLHKYCEEKDINRPIYWSGEMASYYMAEYNFFRENPEYIHEMNEGDVIQTEVS